MLLLCGCGSGEEGIGQALALRSSLLEGNGCSFETTITADYGDATYSFSMDCVSDTEGILEFTVTAPESIAGITGQLASEEGKLTFGETVLAFELLAEDQISPVSAPWILLKTLRGGYIASCPREEACWKLAIDDSFEEDALRLDIWLDEENRPVYADILYDGRRIVSMEVENFTFG